MYILYIYLYVSGFNFITPNTKHFLYFDKKKIFFYFWMELSSRNLDKHKKLPGKKLLYFFPKKCSYISG